MKTIQQLKSDAEKIVGATKNQEVKDLAEIVLELVNRVGDEETRSEILANRHKNAAAQRGAAFR